MRKLEYIPEGCSFNPWRFCPSARHSYRAGQFEKLDCKPEWRMLSHLAGSVERALPYARCSRTCRKKHFWRRNKHSVCNSELKKEFVYWEQEDASNIKIKSLFGFNWLFFLCFSKWSWILFVHFLWVPSAQKSLQGKLWGRFLKWPFMRILIRVGVIAQCCLLLPLLLHVYYKIVIARDGEPSD